MSAKVADEVVHLKSRHQGSAASTVSGSIGNGSGGDHSTSRMVPHTFVASRVELRDGAAGEKFVEQHHTGGGQTTRVYD